MRVTRPVLSTPFTREQGLRLGLTDWTIRTGYVRLLHGVYVSAGVPITPWLRASAALLVAPAGAVVARHTAAVLWGGVVPESPDVHLLVPPGRRVRRDGLDVRETATPDVAVQRGIPMTTPVQTFLDLGEHLDLVQLVVLGDALVRNQPVTPAQLVTASGEHRGQNPRQLRRAAAYLRVGVDSPMESRLRMLLVLAGLPEPVVNHPVRDGTGRVRYRLDLAYPEWRIAIEYDGRQHAEDSRQWRWDVHRREQLDTDGWRLVVVLSGDLYRTPSRTLDRVVKAAADHHVTLAVRSDAWRRYFVDRD